MIHIFEAFKWALIESLRIVGFLFSVTLFLILLMTFIAYPWQTIFTLVIGIFVIISFTFFDEIGR